MLLVLDDYHLIETQPIHDALTFLIDHMPPALQLVIISRIDPPLPLARWRVRNQLAEVRADDLRFASAEATAFLNDAMGLMLSAAEVTALEARTEGWIAGLHLAALSLQGRGDAAEFIRAFSGSHRHVLSYLVEEVLNHHPADTLEFLLQTSILERMSAGLCDAMTGRHDSQQLLEQLEHANLFLIPLDHDRTWYRYHHLFGEVLRNRLRQSDLAPETELRQRASDWCEAAGLLDEAMHYALAANDLERATAIVEQHGIGLLMRSQIALVNNWLQFLPEPLIMARPQLALAAAWIYMAARDLDALEHVLNDTPSLQAADLSAEVQSQRLILRACLAIFHGEFGQAITYARDGLALVPATNLGLRAIALFSIGLGLAQTNDWLGAESVLEETIVVGKAGGNIHNTVMAYSWLSKLQIARGDVAQALQTLQEALHAATQPGQPLLPVVGLIYIGLGTIWVDQGRYDQAALYLQRGEVLAKACFELSELVNGWRAQVKLHLALANPDQAIRVLDGAEAWLSQIVVPQFMRQHMLSVLHTLRASATQPLAPLSRPAATSSPQELVEPLSERELEVLKLVSQGLSNSDIAHSLVVTVGTVKKHLNNIFGKLQVSSRTQAIGRGRELGLLSL
jgi:LuxR family maltose regulon positive regulatory protein